MSEPKIGHDGRGLTTEQLRARTTRQLAERNGHGRQEEAGKCPTCGEWLGRGKGCETCSEFAQESGWNDA